MSSKAENPHMKINGIGYRVACWVGIAIAVVGLGFAAFMGWWLSALWLAALLLYSLWQVAWEDRLPDLFDLLLVAAAVINALGWAFDLFKKFSPYDVIAHGYTVFALTLTLGYLTYYGSRSHFRRHGLLFMVTIFCFGMAIGSLWEIVKWMFGVIGDIHDTIMDLIMDALGASAASALSVWLNKHESEGKAHEPNQPSASALTGAA